MAPSLSELKSHRRLNELVGVLLLSGALAILLALLTFHGDDATWFHHQPSDTAVHNWVGRVGATMADALLLLFGTTALLVPALLLYLGWNRLARRDAGLPLGKLAVFVVLGLFLGALVDLLFDAIVWGGVSFPPGGVVGAAIAGAQQALLNRPGALIFSATAVACSGEIPGTRRRCSPTPVSGSPP